MISIQKQSPKQTTLLSNHCFDNNNDKGANNNNKEETPEMSFAMFEGKCYCCGKTKLDISHHHVI
jgi:hypothetical protein